MNNSKQKKQGLTSDIISDGSSVVMNLEMGLWFALFGGFRFSKRVVFSQMFAHHFVQQGLVSGFWNDAFWKKEDMNLKILDAILTHLIFYLEQVTTRASFLPRVISNQILLHYINQI